MGRFSFLASALVLAAPFAWGGTDTLAPPPVNFAARIVHTDDGSFLVTFDGQSMKMVKLPELGPVREKLVLYDANVLVFKKQMERRRGIKDEEDKEEEIEFPPPFQITTDGGWGCFGCFSTLISMGFLWGFIFALFYGSLFLAVKYLVIGVFVFVFAILAYWLFTNDDTVEEK